MISLNSATDICAPQFAMRLHVCKWVFDPLKLDMCAQRWIQRWEGLKHDASSPVWHVWNRIIYKFEVSLDNSIRLLFTHMHIIVCCSEHPIKVRFYSQRMGQYAASWILDRCLCHCSFHRHICGIYALALPSQYTTVLARECQTGHIMSREEKNVWSLSNKKCISLIKNSMFPFSVELTNVIPFRNLILTNLELERYERLWVCAAVGWWEDNSIGCKFTSHSWINKQYNVRILLLDYSRDTILPQLRPNKDRKEWINRGMFIILN